jgi:hypothetical protein
MKRFVVALIAGAAVFTLAFGAAAALNVNGEVIQAGATFDVVCDADGIQVDGWGLETDTSLVSYVRFAGVDTACDGAAVFVNVIGPFSTEIMEGGPVTVPGGGTVQVPFDAPVNAADIYGLQVFIEG